MLHDIIAAAFLMQELIRWSVKNGMLPPEAKIPAEKKAKVVPCAWTLSAILTRLIKS